MNSILSQIKSVSIAVSEDVSNALRLEEELLYAVTKCEKYDVKLKKDALKRIKEINIDQLRIIGVNIKEVT